MKRVFLLLLLVLMTSMTSASLVDFTDSLTDETQLEFDFTDKLADKTVEPRTEEPLPAATIQLGIILSAGLTDVAESSADIALNGKFAAKLSDEKLLKDLFARELADNSTGVVLVDHKGVRRSAQVKRTPLNKDKYDIEVESAEDSSLVFKGIHVKDVLDLKFEEFSRENFTNNVAFDLTGLNYTNATYTARAKGTALYKCKEWNYSEQQCYGSWVKILDLTPGETYTLELYPEDPALSEAGGIFFDGFENGLNVNWTVNGSGNQWTNSTTEPFNGTQHAEVIQPGNNNPTTMLVNVSTLGFSGISVSYARRLLGIDAADEFAVNWFDGTTWTTLEATGSSAVNGDYVVQNFTLGGTANDNSLFALEFMCEANAGNELCRVDDVFVTGAESVCPGTINTSLTLVENITGTGNCITFDSDNITLDCAGFSITYATTIPASGLFATNKNNITIKDCTLIAGNIVNTSNIAVRLINTSQSSIANNSIVTNGTSNNHGILLESNSNNNTVENNTINAFGNESFNVGIYLLTSASGNSITNNSVSTSGTTSNHGILLQTDSQNNTVTDNIVNASGSANFNVGIYLLTNASGNIISRNNVNTSGTADNTGILLQTESGLNNITDNTIFTFGTSGSNEGIFLLGDSSNNRISMNSIVTNGTDSNHGIILENGTSNNAVVNNTVNTSGTGLFNIGIFAHITAQNNILENNTISTAGLDSNHGFFLTKDANNNTISFNIISVNGTFSFGIGIENISTVTITNNTLMTNVTELHLFDTNDTTLTDTDFNNYSFTNASITIEKKGKGKIKFKEKITGKGKKLKEDVQINETSVFVNATSAPAFNTSAEITFFNTNFTDVLIAVDFENDGTFIECPDNICTLLENNQTTEQVIFNTTQFSRYEIFRALVHVLNLSPITNTGVLLNGSINLTVNATGTLTRTIDIASVNITLPDGTVIPVNLPNQTKDIFNFTFENLTQRGRYNITFVVNDSKGVVNTTITSFFNRQALDVVDIRIANASSQAEENENATDDNITSFAFAEYSVEVVSNVSGILNLSITINNSRIRTINVTAHSEDAVDSLLEIDDRDPSGVSSSAIYAIEPTSLNFTNLTVTVNATGERLRKCADWNFTTRTCPSEFVLVQNITPGQLYTFTMNATDPAFEEGSAAVDVSIAPINLSHFVLAWINSSTSDLVFQVLNTTGSIIVDTVVVDSTVDADSRVSVGMINSTHFAIGWIDGPDDDASFAIYNVNGSNVVAATDADINIGNPNTDVWIAQIGDRFPFCYANDNDNDADFQIFNNTDGTQIVAESNVDGAIVPTLPLQNLIGCAGLNATRWAYLWYDDGQNDATISLVDEAGTIVTGQLDLDTNIGETGQIAITALDNDAYVAVFYDSNEQDITFTVRDIDNNELVAPTDVDITVGTESRVAVAAIRENDSDNIDDFVIAWYNQSEDAIKAAVINRTGAVVTQPFTVDTAPNATFRLMHIAAKNPITGNSLCNGRFIIAYSNSTGQGVYKRFLFNGSEWDGTCPTDVAGPVLNNFVPAEGTTFAPPTLTIVISADATDTTGVDTVTANITFPNSSNEFITLINSGGDTFNSTFTIPGLAGQYNITYVANDTLGQITTGTSFFNAVEKRYSDISLVPINDSIFAAARIDIINNELVYTIENSTGSILVNETVIDASVDNISRVSMAAINETFLAIAWIDGPENDTTIAIININGSFVVSPTDVDTAVGTNTDVWVAELSDRFVVCYANDDDNDADFQIFNNTDGTQIVSESNVDGVINPELTGQNLIGCTSLNSTRWTYAWFDDDGSVNDATIRIVSETGGLISGQTDIDADIGETGQIAIASSNGDAFGVVYYDSTDQDITFTVRDIDNNEILAPMDIETNVGTESRVAIAAVRENQSSTTDAFVIAWYNQSSNQIIATVINKTGSNVTTPFVVDTPDDTFRLMHIAAKDPITGNSLCTGRFVLSYTNSTNEGIFKRLITNGSDWDGTCPADTLGPVIEDIIPVVGTRFAPPTVTIDISANITDVSGVDTVLANITFPNSSNELITLINSTEKTFNSTFTIPGLLGQYNITYIANDTLGNINTETIFFTAVEKRYSDISLVPINDSIFAAARIDIINNELIYTLENSTGSTLVGETVIDASVDNISRVSMAAINETFLAIAWIDGPENDTTIAIININGSFVVSPTDVDTAVGTNTDVWVTQMGDRFPVCYANDADNDADFQIFNNTDGTQIVSESNVDGAMNPELTGQNLIGCTGVNATRWVYAWYDDGDNDATIRIVSETGSLIVGQTDIDADVGETGQIAIASSNGDAFGVVYYDSTDQDITFTVRDIDNNEILAPMDIETNVGTESRVAIAAVRENQSSTTDAFVIAWYNQSSNQIIATVINRTGSNVTTPFVVDTPDDTFRLMHIAAKDPITGNSLCDGRFVLSYTNSTNEGIFKKLITNGSDWDGTCPADVIGPAIADTRPLNGFLFSPPSITVKISANVTDISGVDTVQVNITLPNGSLEQLTLIQNTGDQFNNTFTLPGLEGTYNLTFVANDTLGNINTEISFFLASNPNKGTFVQRGIANTTTSLLFSNISPVDPAKSFVLFLANTGSSAPNNIQFTPNITNSENVTFEKYNSGTSSELRWQVVTGPNISVQRGTEFLLIGQNGVNVTLNPVNTNETFVIVYGRCDSGAAGNFNAGLFLANLTNSTRLQLRRGNEGDCAAAVSYQVVEWDKARVQAGSAVIPTAVDSTSVTVLGMNLSRTFLIFGTASTGTDAGSDSNLIQGNITSENTVFFTKTPGTTVANSERLVHWYSVELPNVNTQSNGIEFNSDVTQVVNRVAPGRSFHVSSHFNGGTGTNYVNTLYTQELTNETEFTFDKQTGTGFNDVSWFLIELPELAVTATNLSPISADSFLLNQTVNLTANTSTEDRISFVTANITLPNGTVLQAELSSNITADIFNGTFSGENLTQRGQYNITYIATDRAGTINTTTETTSFSRAAKDVVDFVGTQDTVFINYSATVVHNVSGMLNLSVDVDDSRISTINISNHDESSVFSIFRIDDEVPRDRNGSFALYGIDASEFNFTNATVFVNATGQQFRKCDNWNFTDRSCIGNFTLQQNITPGQLYSFTINSTDPGFSEFTPASDVALAPFENETFALAFIRNDTNAIEFKLLQTNGTLIANVTIDTTVDTDSRVSIWPINFTHIAVSWVDGPDNAVRQQIFNRTGANTTGVVTVDPMVGTFTDVSVAQLGDRFSICYSNDGDDDADFQVFNNTDGTQVVGETNVDTDINNDATLQNTVECTAMNSTRWVYFWFDDTSNDASYRIIDETGSFITGTIQDIDTDVGQTAQVATTTIDDNKFVMLWYDSTDDDITIAIRDSDNNVILAPTDIETNAGTESRVALATVRRNETETQDSFVAVWYNQTTDNLVAAVFNGTGSTITQPFVIDNNTDSEFRLHDTTARDPITGNEICPGKFVVAYSNNTDQGIFKGFDINGSSWDGVCEVDLPDIEVTDTQIFFNDSHPRENQNITINATINNTGDGEASSVVVQFFDNTSGLQIGSDFTITSIAAGGSVVVNQTYIPIIGNRSILVAADPANTISESDETNNNATAQLNVQAHTIFFGQIQGNLTLSTDTDTFYTWNKTDAGVIYFFDNDSNFNFSALQALGFNTTNGTSFGDFAELDALLNMTNFNDSVTDLWASDNSTAVDVRNFTVFGRRIDKVPVLSSTVEGTFVTGILWDTEDDTNEEFDFAEHEDIVFITNINLSQSGASGSDIDYEIRVPSLIRGYQPTQNITAFISEIR